VDRRETSTVRRKPGPGRSGAQARTRKRPGESEPHRRPSLVRSEGPRLSYSPAEGTELRALEPWRAEEFYAFVKHSGVHLAPWLPWATDIDEPAKAERWLRGCARDLARDGRRLCSIWLDGLLVGGAGFGTFDRPQRGLQHVADQHACRSPSISGVHRAGDLAPPGGVIRGRRNSGGGEPKSKTTVVRRARVSTTHMRFEPLLRPLSGTAP